MTFYSHISIKIFCKQNTPFSSSGNRMCGKRGLEPRPVNIAKSCYVYMRIYHLSFQTNISTRGTHYTLKKKQKIKLVDTVGKK